MGKRKRAYKQIDTIAQWTFGCSTTFSFELFSILKLAVMVHLPWINQRWSRCQDADCILNFNQRKQNHRWRFSRFFNLTFCECQNRMVSSWSALQLLAIFLKLSFMLTSRLSTNWNYIHADSFATRIHCEQPTMWFGHIPWNNCFVSLAATASAVHTYWWMSKRW